MAPLSAPSTPRRSRRHLAQPIVQDEIFAGGNATTGAYEWTSDPIATRSTLADDLYGEDDQIWNESNPGDTTFYTSYVYDAGSAPGRKATKSKSTIKKGKGKQAGPIEYHIGDTVLVTTMAREPSVAVITGMWMTAFSSAKGQEDNESEDEEAEVNAGEERPSKIQERMVVRLHWFTRPKELARVRSKRTAFDVSTRGTFRSVILTYLCSERSIL
jgi:origin recognition complex subunit 1